MHIIGVVIKMDFGIIFDCGQPKMQWNIMQQRFHIGGFTGAGFTHNKNRFAIFHGLFHKTGDIPAVI
ncbi:hypothetical protein D3C73_860100 [compost metagenome]